MAYFLFLFTLLLPIFSPSIHAIENETSFLTSPPKNLPVLVKTKLSFLHLISIDAHDETFSADVYLYCQWKDLRLSYSAPETAYPKTYIGEACSDKLKEIWWPDLEFVNSGVPEYTNRTLFIYPDGTINLIQGITAKFRSQFDYRKLPFDQQALQIVLTSFSWDNSVVVFELDKQGVQLEKHLKAPYEEIKILGASAQIGEFTEEQDTSSKIFSTFTTTLNIQRAPLFYSYQVFFPLLVVIGLCCSVFFIPAQVIADRVMIILTCVLVFIATKFLLNQDLPKIGYLTFIDKIFFISYTYAGLVTITCFIEYGFWKRKNPHAEKFSKIASYLGPILYLLACGILLLSEIL